MCSFPWRGPARGRRIGLGLPGGEFSDEAIASCKLRYAYDERWAGVERLAQGAAAATTATPDEIQEGRRRVEATAAFEVLATAPVVKVSISFSSAFRRA